MDRTERASEDNPGTGAGKNVWTRSGAVGFIELVCAMALAGSSVVAGKYLTGMLPVFLNGTLGLLCAVLCIIPFQIPRRKELLSLNRRDVMNMVLQAFFGIVLFRICMLSGLRMTTAFNAGIVTSASPAVMTILSVLFLREHPGVKRLAGVLFSAAGILIINISGSNAGSGRGGADAAGLTLILLAVISEGLLIVFRKSARQSVSAVTNTFGVCLSGFLMMLPIAFFELPSFDPAVIPPAAWLVILYYGAAVTAGGYLLMSHGAPRIAGSSVGLAMSSMPISAFLLSVLFLGENVRLIDAAGGILAIFGMILGS